MNRPPPAPGGGGRLLEGVKTGMFFDNWLLGIIFGFITTVALLAIGYPFARMWDKYEDPKPAAGSHGCDHGH
ncbi:hypothetical protein DCCM_4074 [Desulfocucumis palustris]|uniref:Uncharacterized protein n=2 Tax=Desulfocucumis palustris TaxID=1898651 RepID=A0A2L2XG32_9FIRM|nr:hypothetical protein DCCM_4074 [Desulfocucumis palustris]